MRLVVQSRVWSLTCVLIGLVLVSPARAQDIPGDPPPPLPRMSSLTEARLQEEVLYLKEETVSIATRHEQPISQAPSNVYVITDEDIRNAGATDIPTVLRRIPGLEVMQVGSIDFNVSMRGDNQLAANKLLVLVDGRSIYIDAATLVRWNLLPVTLPEIKRIEVLKGPASAVYGFNAFDGVINIITKPPEEMKGTTLQITGGQLGTITSSAVHAGSVNRFSYRVSVGQDRIQQWRNRDALALDLWKINSHTEYLLPNQSLIAFDLGLARSGVFDGPNTGDAIQRSQDTQPYAYVSYKGEHLAVRGWWNGFYNDGQTITNPTLAPIYKILNRVGGTANHTDINSYNIEADYSRRVFANLLLSAGINYRHNVAVMSVLTERTKEDRLGLYFNGEWNITNSLTATAGIRYDLDTFINPTYSPRAALIYSLREGHTLRISGGVAYRPPGAAERNLLVLTQVALPSGAISIPAFGSRDLVAEEIVSYDLGYSGWFLQHRLRLRADVFYNRLSHLITSRAISSSQIGPQQLTNGNTADIYGGEIGVEYLWNSWLSGFANMSYQRFHQSNTGFIRRGMPRFKWNAGIRGSWESGINAELLYHYVGSAIYPLSDPFFSLSPLLLPAGIILPTEHVDSYHLLNLRIGYRFWKQQAEAGYMREAEIALSAFNVLNDEHRENPVGDIIGSRVLGWLTVKL